MARKYLILTLPIAVFTLTIAPVRASAEIAPVELAAVSNIAGETDIDSRRFPDIDIVGVTYGGSGCRQGTASVSILGNQMSILFDAYQAQTRPGYNHAYKDCNIAVAIRIPPGYSISLLKIDYRGYGYIPLGGSGRLHAEYFFAGYLGPVYERHFPPGYHGIYRVTDFVGGGVWSPCGRNVIARANTSVTATKRSSYSTPEATLTVASADVRVGIIYYFNYRRC